jgi:hypothetical protein
MSLVYSKKYLASLKAGFSEEEAEEAARVPENPWDSLNRKVSQIKWLVGVALVLTYGILIHLLFVIDFK